MATNQTGSPPPSTRTLDWGSIVRKVWGDDWLKRDTAYEFSNGRKFQDTGPDSGIYED